MYNGPDIFLNFADLLYEDNSLDDISANNRASLHDSMLNHERPETIGSLNSIEMTGPDPSEVHESQKTPKPRRSGPLKGLRDRFNTNSLEDISKDNRASMHESMLPLEVKSITIHQLIPY